MTHRQLASPHVPRAPTACGLTYAAIVLCVAALAGCANPCPPFRAAWYLDDSQQAASTAAAVIAAASAAAPAAAAAAPNTSAAPAAPVSPPPTVFLALLNEGPKKLKISRLSVNPDDLNDGTAVFLWPDPASAANPELSPGELRLFVVNDPDDCVLPVVVKLHCGTGGSHTQAVSGSLPNYLHTYWIKSCVRRANR